MKHKFKKGDIVTCSRKEILWHSRHIDCYMRGGSFLLEKCDFKEVHFWLTHAINKTGPVGKIVKFGKSEDRYDRVSTVTVRFNHLGKKIDVIFYDKDLSYVKKS